MPSTSSTTPNSIRWSSFCEPIPSTRSRSFAPEYQSNPLCPYPLSLSLFFFFFDFFRCIMDWLLIHCLCQHSGWPGPATRRALQVVSPSSAQPTSIAAAAPSLIFARLCVCVTGNCEECSIPKKKSFASPSLRYKLTRYLKKKKSPTCSWNAFRRSVFHLVLMFLIFFIVDIIGRPIRAARSSTSSASNWRNYGRMFSRQQFH